MNAPAGGPLFDPDLPELMAPGNMPARIRAVCEQCGQLGPGERDVLIRAVFESLACKYRLVLEEIERVTGTPIEVVHVIGGGARNEFLCRLTANVTQRPVLAGPVEAAALGNILVQLTHFGELASPAEMRELVRSSTEIRVFEPDPDAPAGRRSTTASPSSSARRVRQELPRDGLRPPRRLAGRPRRRDRADRGRAARSTDRDAVVGIRQLGHALRRLRAARRAADDPREARGRRRGSPPHGHRTLGRAPHPLGPRRGLRGAARLGRRARPAARRDQPEPLPGAGLQARQRVQPRSARAPQGDRPHPRVHRDRGAHGLGLDLALARGRHELSRARTRSPPGGSGSSSRCRRPTPPCPRRSSCSSNTSSTSRRSTRPTSPTGARR